MKSLKIIMLLLCTAFMLHAQTITVSGSTKLNTDFSVFKTFAWQTTASNELIRSAIKEELEARGYYQNDANPDLVVSYQVLERTMRIKGYTNDTPAVVSGEEVREPKDTITYTVQPGTLMISFMNRKTSEAVWDGFASGVANDGTFVKDEKKVKEIVHMIFEQFKHRAVPLEY